MPAHPARRVGRYLLCDQIGSGGMATIHLARLLGPQGFSRTVAIKKLHPQFAQNRQFVAMLLDEARLAVRIRHANVVSPLDVVAADSELFIVMDYVNGESFANLLAASEGPLRPPLAAAILVQVLLGLHAAHEATREQGEALGLVHRDVSPQNIQVGQDGVARMLDFGIAKAVARAQKTEGGIVKGKLGYLSPEQVKVQAVDRRSDLFSAGIVLWEALTGAGLFVSDSIGDSIELILHAEIAPPSRFNPAVTPELDAVVLRALARDPQARFQDGVSMATALQHATRLASALEVIEWLERLAGPELARRAELVRRAEALDWEPDPETPPTLGAASIALSALGAGRTAAEAMPPSSRVRMSTLMGLAAPFGGAMARPVPSLIAETATEGTFASSAEATSVGVDREHHTSARIEEKRSPDRRAIGAALGIVLAASAAALGLVSWQWAEPEEVEPPPLEVAAPLLVAPRPALAAAMPDPAMVDLSPRVPRIRVVSGPLPPWPSDESPATAAPDSAASIPSSPRAPSRNGPTRAARPARSSPLGMSASAALPSAGAEPAIHQRLRSIRAANACEPPWVVNEQQVKIFKAECLR